MIYIPVKKNIFNGLKTQCAQLGIETVEILPDLLDFTLVVDALFGFSFRGPIREPYKAVIDALANSKTPVLAVDVPSGWDVESGDVYKTSYVPAAVVSLTAPKLCLKSYAGVHFIGGRLSLTSIRLSWVI